MSIISEIIVGLPAMYSAFSHLWNGRKDEILDLSKQNTELGRQVNLLTLQIVRLKEKADADRLKYDQIRQYFETRTMILRRTDNVMFLGPKGSGKSTFLWLRGYSDKPTPTFGDGTIEIGGVGNVIDTIGVDFQFHQILKLMAVMICKGAFPLSLVVVSNDHQAPQAISVLASLCINNYHIVSINSAVVYALPEQMISDNPMIIYNQHVYDAVNRDHPSVRPITHMDKFQKLNSFHTMLDVFQGERVSLPDYDSFSNSRSTKDVVRYWLCRYVHEYEMMYTGNTLKFLNNVDV